MAISFKDIMNNFDSDIEFYDSNVTDIDSFLTNIKNEIKNNTKAYYETKDKKEKDEILLALFRYYDLLFYIQGKINKQEMYTLDGEIDSLPDIYLVDQKPELFDVDFDTIGNINVSSGLTEYEACELLKLISNNTRLNINMSIGNNDVYDNYSTRNDCGFAQFSSLYPLEKLGLTITINNMQDLTCCNHAYGSVIIPINQNGEIVNKRYIIDLTYRQFFAISNNVFSRYFDKSPDPGFFVIQDDNNIKFSKELIKNGFFEATDENKKAYFKPFYAMSLGLYNIEELDQEFLKVNIDNILNNYQRNFDYTEEEFINWGMNLDLGIKEKRI